MPRSSALGRLLESLRRAPHDMRPSIEIFPDLDVARVAAELELERLGHERGARNEPASEASAPDEVEARIIERVEAEKKKAHAVLEDELRTYAERLAGLDLEGRFGTIRQAAPAAIGEFRAEVARGRDELHALRRSLYEHEQERDAFRARHRLTLRAARVQSGVARFLKMALIALLLLVETWINGTFLAKGSDQGLIGGITEAAGFALLNVGASVLLAYFGLVQLNHRSLFRKLLGLVALVVYVALALALNLALAHYREVSGALATGAGQEVIRRLSEAPLLLADLQSWIFAGIGLLFSIVAMIDGLSLSDPYPGYKDVEARLGAARDAYRDGKDALIDTLLEIRDAYREEMDEISRDLSVRRSEHDAILASRARLIQLFNQHQAQLERAGNALMTIYRDANLRRRDSEPPARFATAFILDRIAVALPDDEAARSATRASIAASQEFLIRQIETIHSEFDAAVRHYRQLDDLVPETPRGTA